MQVGMTMPQMGEFSIAIGRLSPSDALGVAPLGTILSIATAATSVLSPLTARASQPLCNWLDRRSPTILHRILLAIRLGVDTFWAALSLTGEPGTRLRNAGRGILINFSIIVVLAAAGTGALYTAPVIFGDSLLGSQGIAGLTVDGVVIGLSTPSAISIWRSLRTLARLATGDSDESVYGLGSHQARYALRTMVQNGLATVFLALVFLPSLPLIVRLLVLGSLSAPISLILLLAPMLAMGIVSFSVHRVLEPAFNETFTNETVDPASRSEDARTSGVGLPTPQPAVEQSTDYPLGSESHRRLGDPLVVDVIERLEEQDELWHLLEERIACKREADDTTSPDRPAAPGHTD